MADPAAKTVPALLNPFQKYLPSFLKVFRYLYGWKLFWLLVLVWICSTVYYPPMSSLFINLLAKQNPPFSELPENAAPDHKMTVLYKKEKLNAVRISLKNLVLVVQRDLGMEAAEGKVVSRTSLKMPVSSKIDIDLPEMEPAKGSLDLLKDNLAAAFTSYLDMLTVRIVSINNQPVIVGEDGQVVPYFKTDNILRWARLIEAAAEKYNTDPAIIAAIIEQESGGKADAVSHAGAVGLMQLMPRTAKGLGVNPYDPAQNIDGGTRYFLNQYQTFGSIELALAAYNAGPNNVRDGNYLYFTETQGYITRVPMLIEKYQKIFTQSRNT